jgi:hypothetical protein
MPRKAGENSKRKRPADTFEAFVEDVRAELAGRIGGERAAGHAVNDPAFAVAFAVGFDLRKVVANPARRTANIIIDALAAEWVRARLGNGSGVSVSPGTTSIDPHFGVDASASSGIPIVPVCRVTGVARPKSTPSKTGGGEPSVESLSRSTVPEQVEGVGDGTGEGDPI